MIITVSVENEFSLPKDISNLGQIYFSESRIGSLNKVSMSFDLAKRGSMRRNSSE